MDGGRGEIDPLRSPFVCSAGTRRVIEVSFGRVCKIAAAAGSTRRGRFSWVARGARKTLGSCGRGVWKYCGTDLQKWA